MEKIIWIIGNNKHEIIAAQRLINQSGSMRAICMMSYKAVQKSLSANKAFMSHETNIELNRKAINHPSLMIVDYDMLLKEDFRTLFLLQKEQSLAGIPLFFMVRERNSEQDEECYRHGATVVVGKPFNRTAILRIERTAWQYEVTRNYEKMIQKQASDLATAHEIMYLNKQLEARSALLHQIFGRYFSDKVLESILENPKGAVIGGEKRTMTVLMADLRGFTAVSEEISSEALTDLLNFFFSQMVDVIMSYNGTVIEFLGDGILAVFGSPITAEHPSDDAVAAAILMQNCMKQVNDYCTEKGLPALEMGIGIHQGEAFIGNVGSERMMRYNVVGNLVNECSRIESTSVGGQVLVSETVVKDLFSPVDITDTKILRAKGLANPMLVSEIQKIGGDYGYCLTGSERLALHPLSHPAPLELYRIEGKVIQNRKFTGTVTHISDKQAYVTLTENAAKYFEIADEAGLLTEVSGTYVYAKITYVEDNLLHLYFTKTTGEFRKQIENWLKEADSL